MNRLTENDCQELIWEQQLALARIGGDYDQAAKICEQQIQKIPQDRRAYWHLGLIQLLQEREEDAQLTWLSILAEAPSEEAENWGNELLEVLECAVKEQINLENFQLAWLLRQYIKEFFPAQIDNLLHLIQLSVKLHRLEATEISELGLIDLLNDYSQPVPLELLLHTVEQLPDLVLYENETIQLVEACLHHATAKPQPWIEFILSKVPILCRLGQEPIACTYLEIGLRLEEEHPRLIRFLARMYLTTKQNFDKSIELAELSYQRSDLLIDKLYDCHLLIDAYLSKGSLWEQAEQILPCLINYLEHWTTVHLDNLADDGIEAALCNGMFVLPYFNDYPTQTRQLQNKIGQAYQERIQALACQSNTEYQSFPKETIAHITTEKVRDKKKIRIGYIAQTMRRHSVGWLCRWLFHHHDRERFEIYAYFNHQLNIDSFSEQWFVGNADKAFTFDGDPLGIAQTIQDHGIDILIDLDSLTNAKTYSVLALKPAPIQVSWLGLDATGLPAVDYFMVDPYVVPEFAQDYYSEKLWCLPQTYLAVDGFEIWMPTVSRSDLNIPADATVYLTAQIAFKLHPETLRLQFKILQNVPESYFLVKGFGDSAGIQALFHQLADEAGVDCDRLRFLGRTRFEENHRANLAMADVVLDTFPYNGATTTMETLWMGIPLVTKVGQQFAARNSYTMILNAGISEGIAWSDEEYVEWGIRLGQDPDLREQISWKLRQGRRTAPLWNAKEFTRQMEAAYEEMWAIYSQGGH